MNEYGLFKNGEMLHRGTASQLGKQFFISKESIYTCEITGRKLNGEYSVRMIGEYVPPEKKKPPKEEKVKCDAEYLLRHLRLHGNVYTNRKPSESDYEILRENGFDVDTKVYKNGKKADYILIAR